jgi:hypothetical protein
VTAAIALVDVPAERSGAAGGDVLQHPPLGERESTVLVQALTGGAHQVGDLESRSRRVHVRASSEQESVVTDQDVQRTARSGDVLDGDVDVPLRRAQ